MANLTHFRAVTRIAFSSALICGGVVRAQEPSQEQIQKNAAPSCEQPPPLVRLQDYDGPFAKIAGTFARKLERKSVHPPHYKPNAALCTLRVKDKFILFVQDSFDPITFLSAGFNAGIDQAENNDPAYGQGAAGYGKRFGANYAGQVSSGFFKDFAYPTIFAEDPRYYRLAHGSGKKRLLHALEHAFVGHTENGKPMFNASEWFGTTSAVVLANTYHPDNKRGFAAAARGVGYSVLSDTGFDVLREFWPEMARKFRLPFRDQHEPAIKASVPDSQ